MSEVVCEALLRLVRTAREEGRRALTEPEGLDLVAALGIGVPAHVVFGGPEDVDGLDLDAFPDGRLVLKVVSPRILHKSDVGGVRFLEKDRSAIRAAVTDMESRLGDQDVRGYLLAAFVPHDPSLGGQLLLGMRWTNDYGPVLTFGPGGVHAEFLARHLQPGRNSAILSPILSSKRTIEAALEQTAITPAATGRLRGQESRVSLEDLRDLIARLLRFADAAIPDQLSEFEINPLVFTADGPVALDALGKLGIETPIVAPPRPIEKLDRLLRPRSIGIVGVSSGMNPGHVILNNVIRNGFPREAITVVKPGRDEIEGCRCVPDVTSMPEPVDLFVVCVDAHQVPDLFLDLIAQQKAESVILIAGGLGERRGSEVHVERIRHALHEARRSEWGGPVINGGNCLGVRSLPGRYDTMFIPEHKLHYAEGPPMPFAVIAQSGAFAVTRASKLSAMNPRTLVTLGNQIDLTVADYLEHLAADPEIQVFACYVEGFRPGDGERWLRATEAITKSGRAVLLYRAGRTPAGQEATASHTASIAGDYAVTRALAREAGAVVAETLEDFDDLIRLFCLLRDKAVEGWNLGALSNAGFELVAMADNIGSFHLADFTAETHERLGAMLASRRIDSIVGVKNLLDLTPIVDDEAYEEAIRAVLDDDNVDVGVIGCVPMTGALQTVTPGDSHGEDLTAEGSIVRRLIRLHRESRKAWVGVVDAGPLYDPMVDLLLSEGVPTFRAADRALRLLARYCAWRMRS